MTQPPITVTYSLEEILGKIDSKLDKLQDKSDVLCCSQIQRPFSLPQKTLNN